MTLWERLQAATPDNPIWRSCLTPDERRQADKWCRTRYGAMPPFRRAYLLDDEYMRTRRKRYHYYRTEA